MKFFLCAPQLKSAIASANASLGRTLRHPNVDLEVEEPRRQSRLSCGAQKKDSSLIYARRQFKRLLGRFPRASEAVQSEFWRSVNNP